MILLHNDHAADSPAFSCLLTAEKQLHELRDENDAEGKPEDLKPHDKAKRHSSEKCTCKLNDKNLQKEGNGYYQKHDPVLE